MSMLVARLALGLLGVSVGWGFATRPMIHQGIWSGPGAERLAVFAAVYSLLAGIFLWAAPARFTVILAGIGLAYAVWWTGPLAVLSLIAFGAAAFVVGRRATGQEDVFAWIAGVGIYSWVTGWLVFLPVNNAWLYAALFLVPLALEWRAVVRLAQRMAEASPEAPPAWVRFAFGFVLLAHLVVVLKPEAGPDALAMHLVIPATVAWRGRWPFDVEQFLWAVMPMGANWTFTAVYLTGGEWACRLLNFGYFLALLAQTAATARRWAPPHYAALAALLLAATPITQLVTGSLYAENYWALMVLGMMEAGWRGRGRAFGWLAGCALAAKTGSVSLAAAAVGAFALLRRIPKPDWVPGTLLFLAAGGVPYVNAWWRTGNPLFPFLNAWFRSPLIEAESIADGRFAEGLGWDTLYQLTFASGRYFEGQDGAFGFHWLVLLPPAILIGGRLRDPGGPLAALAAIVAYAAATFTWQANLRYLYPVLPLASVLAACALGFLPRRAASALAAVFTILNFAFFPASGWLHRDFGLNPLRKTDELRKYTEFYAPTRPLIEKLNREHPGETVACLGGNAVAGLRARVWTQSWHSPRFEKRLRTAGSGEEVAAILREYGVRQVLLPAASLALPTTSLRDFAGRFLDTQAGNIWFRAALLQASPLAPRDIVLTPGRYDDDYPGFRYRGPWLRGATFEGALEKTLTYCDRPGAEMTFRFRGRTLTYLFTRAYNRGTASVWLDGQRAGAVDQFSRGVEWQQRAVFQTSEGVHTATVRIEPTRSPGASANHVDVDGWEIE